MIIKYRNRELNINQQYIDDFAHFTGGIINQDDIDTFIYNKYIWDQARENETEQVANSLTDDEIIQIIEKALITRNRAYFMDPAYGDSNEK